jgi:hypothetical protein
MEKETQDHVEMPITPTSPTTMAEPAPGHGHHGEDREVSTALQEGNKKADWSLFLLQVAAVIGDGPMTIDEQTNKKLFWTVNRRILACMLGTYFCQSLDKGTLGFSSVMGIQKDANLVGQQFSYVTGPPFTWLPR